MQPAFTTKLTDRARKVVSFPWVLKDREQARRGYGHFDANVLGNYRSYLDERLAQLRRELTEMLVYRRSVVSELEHSFDSDREDLEDELSSVDSRIGFIRATLGRYRKELDGVLELENRSAEGVTI
jgi:hypothetical protein